MHPQVLQCIVTCVVAAVVGLYAASRRERDDVRWPVIGFAAAIFVWASALGARSVLGDGALGLLAYYGFYAGAVAIGPLWVVLAARVTRAPWLSRRRAQLLWIPSVLAYLAMLTNPWHGLYLQMPLPRLEDSLVASAGPLLWVYVVWSYLLVSAGIAIYVRAGIAWMRSGEPVRGAGIVLAALLPLITGLLRTFDVTTATQNMTPLAIAVAVGCLFFLHWRHRLCETIPLARRDVIERLVDGVIVLDDTGTVLDANPAAAEILGVDAGSLRGRSIREVLLDSKTPMGEEEYGRAETHVEDSSGPWVYTFQTSDDRLIESTTEWVDGGEGATAGYIIVLRDHTERRRTERFLRQGQRLESVAALSAGIAHEINNPLAFLRSNLNYIDELARELARDAQERGTGKPQGFDELQSVVAECRDGAERIGGIVDRVRRFSHLQPEELHPVDMHGVIRDAVKLAQLQPSGELTLEMRIESCLPQVQGSHEHLVQALLNLLVNARHAAMTGDEPHVEVTCMRQDHQLLTRVRDSGPGISSHVRGRIFDPFFTTKAPGEGTGLGLPIAYGIAREHGGSLECRSPDDCGAEFCLSLPIAPEDDTP